MSNKTLHSRRNFLRQNAVLAGAAAVGGLSGQFSSGRVHAAETSQIKIGLVGCGGRGCGAVVNALTVDPNVVLTSIGDVFTEKVDEAVKQLRDVFGSRIAVTPETTFSGFDCYKKVIETCDVVLLCTPQHFRPMTLKAAIEAGKHVFCEKPVAVDMPGIRSVFESCRIAREKKLNIVSGLANRYSPRVRDIVNRIHDGAVGEIITAQANRMGGEVWVRPRVEGDTEMKYQMRNWLNFDWLGAGFITDVSIHQVDVALWCLGDATPVSAYGVGSLFGRAMQPDSGDIYDSMAVVYEYADGRSLYVFTRQTDNCFSSSDVVVRGTKGRAILGGTRGTVGILGANPYTPPASTANASEIEHKVLYDAIRSGGATYVNNGDYMTNSTMAVLLGWKVCTTGRKITWDEMLRSEDSFTPPSYSWDTLPPTLPNENGKYKLYYPGKAPEYPA